MGKYQLIIGDVSPEALTVTSAIYKSGGLAGYDLAIKALREYRPESEEVTACLHSIEWAKWLESKRDELLTELK